MEQLLEVLNQILAALKGGDVEGATSAVEQLIASVSGQGAEGGEQKQPTARENLDKTLTAAGYED